VPCLTAKNASTIVKKDNENTNEEEGAMALILISLTLIGISICFIALHYCNFKERNKYNKLQKQNEEELVEIDLYESDN